MTTLNIARKLYIYRAGRIAIKRNGRGCHTQLTILRLSDFLCFNPERWIKKFLQWSGLKHKNLTVFGLPRRRDMLPYIYNFLGMGAPTTKNIKAETVMFI